MSNLIDRQVAINAVEESRRLNHHQDGKEACAHEYEHRHFLKILNDLPDAQRWIPCSERLPERNQICIVTDETRRCAYEYGLHDETYDEENGWTYLGHKIIAWMPLPEPYIQ